MRLFVTGGAGFIGCNFIRHVLGVQRSVRVINFDKLTYAGSMENLAGLSEDPRYTFIRGDVANAQEVEAALDPRVDAIINFAAETHVDRSILDASAFVRTNVVGTQILLEVARQRKIPCFIQISTDEVYGSLGPKSRSQEEDRLAPNSPYAASKAAGELLARSYHKTYGLPVIVTRSSNNYGPYQFPEKFIPLMIVNALEEKPLPVYGDGLHRRDWIHVKDHCRALEQVLLRGQPGRVYNIGANQERSNLEVVRRILKTLQKPLGLIRLVDDRPGHDRRYAMDTHRVREQFGWSPHIPLDRGLGETIQWYRQHPEWIRHVRSSSYFNYYRRMYEERAETLTNL